MTTENTNTTLVSAYAFARLHLKDCARDLIELSETGILPKGRVRELEEICAKTVGQSTTFRVAESIVNWAALEYVASLD